MTPYPLRLSGIFLLVASCYVLVASPAHATNYYISPTGNDINPGTQALPWRTLGHALNDSDATAGDTIYLRQGTYSENNLYFNAGGPEGENGNYLVIKNYASETPTFNHTQIRFTDRNYIHVEGLTFTNVQQVSLSARVLNRSVAGIKFINNTFINDSVSPVTDTSHIRVSTTGSSGSIPTMYQRYQDVLIQGNQIFENNPAIESDAAEAIQVGGNVDYVRILDNYLETTTGIGIGIAGRTWKNNDALPKDADDLNVDQPDHLLIKGNTLDTISLGNAIYLDAPGDYFVVEDNEVFEGNNGIQVAGEGVASDLHYRYGIVRRNTVYNNRYNLITGGRSSAHRTELEPEPTDCIEVIGAKDMAVVHNTFFADYGRTTVMNRFQCVENFRYKNNIVVNTHNDASKIINQRSRAWIDFSTWGIDNNLYYFGTNSSKRFDWTSVMYDTFAAYRTGTGKDTNSVVANPQFINATNRNFELAPSSPAIDTAAALTRTTAAGSGTQITVLDARYFTHGFGLQAGDLIKIGDQTARVTAVNYPANRLTIDRNLTWSANQPVNYDYAGNGPDIGAFESSYTAPPTPTPNPNATPTHTPAPSNSPTPSGAPTPEPGDADGDQDVDLQDYNIILSNFGRTGNIPRNQGDLDQNGSVDLQDFNQVVSNFGN